MRISAYNFLIKTQGTEQCDSMCQANSQCSMLQAGLRTYIPEESHFEGLSPWVVAMVQELLRLHALYCCPRTKERGIAGTVQDRA